jgi:hypothetical protein
MVQQIVNLSVGIVKYKIIKYVYAASPPSIQQ